jgi:hypothetical protein
MIEMLITDLDGILADRLLHLAGPDSLRHRPFVFDRLSVLDRHFVVDNDESERAHEDYIAGFSIFVIERTRESIASNAQKARFASPPCFLGLRNG